MSTVIGLSYHFLASVKTLVCVFGQTDVTPVNISLLLLAGGDRETAEAPASPRL